MFPCPFSYLTTAGRFGICIPSRSRIESCQCRTTKKKIEVRTDDVASLHQTIDHAVDHATVEPALLVINDHDPLVHARARYIDALVDPKNANDDR